MRTSEITVGTSRSRITDLTDEVASFARGLGDGLVSVFASHGNPIRKIRLSFVSG